jgi:hypothetical protein
MPNLFSIGKNGLTFGTNCITVWYLKARSFYNEEPDFAVSHGNNERPGSCNNAFVSKNLRDPAGPLVTWNQHGHCGTGVVWF